MNGEDQFVTDYFSCLEELARLSGYDEFQLVFSAAAVFLADWGVDLGRLSSTTTAFAEGLPHSSDELEAARNRMAAILVTRLTDRDRFFTQMTALCAVDNNVTDSETVLMAVWLTRLGLDLEYGEKLIRRGGAVGFLMANFARVYAGKLE